MPGVTFSDWPSVTFFSLLKQQNHFFNEHICLRETLVKEMSEAKKGNSNAENLRKKDIYLYSISKEVNLFFNFIFIGLDKTVTCFQVEGEIRHQSHLNNLVLLWAQSPKEIAKMLHVCCKASQTENFKNHTVKRTHNLFP